MVEKLLITQNNGSITVMAQVETRRRGRPKGSRNKNKLLSGKSVAQICEYHKFNPTSFLVGVANGTEGSESWTKDDRLRAATKLHDSIHNNRALNGGLDGDGIDGQIELVFVEESGCFELPGEAGAEGFAPALPREQI